MRGGLACGHRVSPHGRTSLYTVQCTVPGWSNQCSSVWGASLHLGQVGSVDSSGRCLYAGNRILSLLLWLLLAYVSPANFSEIYLGWVPACNVPSDFFWRLDGKNDGTIMTSLIYRPFSRTIRVSQYWNDSVLDLTGATDDKVLVTTGAIRHPKLQSNHHPPIKQHQFFLQAG